MDIVIYIIGSFMLLGGLGMLLANQKVDKQIANSRWVKYFSYLVIIAIVIASMKFYVFEYVAIVIIVVGHIEILLALIKNKTHAIYWILTFLFFTPLTVLFFGFASFLFEPPQLLFIYLQVIVFDAFCQVTGQLFGKRKFLPSISPSKTVEGLLGGSVLCILTAVLLSAYVDVPKLQAFYSGLITVVSSFLGDLLASWFKRKMKIKDFSNLLPGQGGVLDRFDSFLLTGAVYFAIGIFLISTMGIC